MQTEISSVQVYRDTYIHSAHAHARARARTHTHKQTHTHTRIHTQVGGERETEIERDRETELVTGFQRPVNRTGSPQDEKRERDRDRRDSHRENGVKPYERWKPWKKQRPFRVTLFDIR